MARRNWPTLFNVIGSAHYRDVMNVILQGDAFVCWLVSGVPTIHLRLARWALKGSNIFRLSHWLCPLGSGGDAGGGLRLETRQRSSS